MKILVLYLYFQLNGMNDFQPTRYLFNMVIKF